jgi:hypothetical protein
LGVGRGEGGHRHQSRWWLVALRLLCVQAYRPCILHQSHDWGIVYLGAPCALFLDRLACARGKFGLLPPGGFPDFSGGRIFLILLQPHDKLVNLCCKS